MELKLWSFVGLPCVLYFLTVSKIAVMYSLRYIAPAYGIVTILLMDIICFIIESEKIKLIAAILLAGIIY